MNNRILKYELNHYGLTPIYTNGKPSKILGVDKDPNGNLCVWLVGKPVIEDEPLTEYVTLFQTTFTGDELPVSDGVNPEYIGSVTIENLVLHVFQWPPL